MDNELFLKRLQELAELDHHKPSKNPKRQGFDLVWRHGQEMQITDHNNPTRSVEIKQVKPITKDCEDCGLLITNRTVQISVYSFPLPHWRRTCRSCQKVCNPLTGQFDIPSEQSQAFFISFLKRPDK